MARNLDFKIERKKPEISRMNGWIRGENTLVSATQIKDNELAEALDIQLVEDGKIQCPRDGQAYYGTSNGSRVHGIFPYYKSNGTKKLLRSVVTTLQSHNTSTNGWDNISGYAYTTGLDTEGVMAYDRLYLVNGTDPLTYYDGSSITTFTAISTPANPAVARSAGSAGSFTFSYKVTAVTAVGETLPTAAVSSTLDQDVLDSSHYMTVSWTASTNAIGYNVYGRKDGMWYFMKYLEGNSSVSYADKGEETPYEVIIPPEENTTAGPVGKDMALYKDTIFIIGDPDNPSRLFYSAGGDKINDFSASYGGGFIDIAKNDGQKGTALQLFKDRLLVFKEDSIYQFSFASDGAPTVEQVTSAVGCVSTRSVVTVENDVFFMGRRGVFTIGNEAGFAFDVLRTNELSAKVRSTVQAIDTAYMDKVSAVYATKANKNLVIFSYTPSGSTYNSKAIIYDRERLAWYRWTNVQANCWTNYIDTTGNTRVLYGDDNSGYVKEILTGEDDFGSNISGSIKLKAVPFKSINQYKKLQDFSVTLRNPSGGVNASIIVDGATTAYQTNASTVSPTINFSHYIFTKFLFGESYGSGAITSTDELVTRTKKNLNIEGRTFQLSINNGSSGASFILLAAEMIVKPKPERYRPSSDIIQ